ncbi:metallophosphoesterase family protein [Nitratireductor aquibiodomus]|uniref:metallophosphoesterase n=1 Tax=Nitratireductor aquibiodomus TaxID=204799 RepID=UPI0019D378B1|nr:metallophosphoesterase [Nitratireductor aquibiodomus]MBN7759810.1 metallophosphoesterase family protein [Nitratireductor aquibiodomus]
MKRITEIELGTATAGILGDPHLGRSFVRGVSLEKRGLREQHVMDDFKERLHQAGSYDLFICMGDLFDKWAVPYNILFQTTMAFLEAATTSPSTQFIVLAGNHDISRDLEKRGALDLFELVTHSLPNIHVVRHSGDAYFTEAGGKRLGFFPFHPTKRAEELVTEPLDVAFGHWDTIFGDDNLIPTKKLAEMGCEIAYTGHVHLPDQFKRDGVDVIQVGSMQPYAHGEDNGEMYVTLTLDEIEGKDLADKCVRVSLAPGEVLDQEVDCLQLTVRREGTSAEDDDEVSMGDFDLMSLFTQAFEEADVPPPVRTQLIERFEEARVKE